MIIRFLNARPGKIPCEVLFFDRTVYKTACRPSISPYSILMIGRQLHEVRKIKYCYEDYWYEYYPVATDTASFVKPDVLDIDLKDKDKYTQMLRDAAMRAKPED
jgi:hypothetical protein